MIPSVGSMVHPSPFWNNSERPPNQLPDECEVLDVSINEQKSQTGIMLTVLDKSGHTRKLDYAWFNEGLLHIIEAMP